MFYICIVIKERNNNNSNTVGIMRERFGLDVLLDAEEID